MTCCDASGSRKRARDPREPSVLVDVMNNSNDNLPNHYLYGEQPARVTGSTRTSTGGRPAIPPLALELYSHVYHHNIEIDAINERLRLLLDESRKRQWRAVVENSKVAMKRLREKEMELEIARWKNAVLEEKMRQLSAENQVGLNVARNNEAVISTLKSSLEQLLLRVNAAAAPPHVTEGYGDSEGGSNDAHSCCFEGDYAVRRRTAARTSSKCRVCSQNDVGVLLLPCWHLCVCKECESKVDTCPICNGSKNACLQIFLS